MTNVVIVAGFQGQSASAVDDDEITFEDRSEGEVKFPYSAVAKANLKFDIQDDLKRG